VHRQRSTRGFGLLESFLARRRGNLAKSLIPLAARKGKILDIGCGTFPSFLLSLRCQEKFAVDRYDPSSFDNLPGGDVISYHQVDIEKADRLPFDRDFFDIVTMLAVVEHLQPECAKRVVAEIFRILKTGGICILTTPAPWTKDLLRVLSFVRLVSPDEIAEHKSAYSHADMRAVLAACGFNTRRLRFGAFELQMNLWAVAKK
jgi:SAM-dependent methyltransferase